jgi:hypothetical protein
MSGGEISGNTVDNQPNQMSAYIQLQYGGVSDYVNFYWGEESYGRVDGVLKASPSVASDSPIYNPPTGHIDGDGLPMPVPDQNGHLYPGATKIEASKTPFAD